MRRRESWLWGLAGLPALLFILVPLAALAGHTTAEELRHSLAPPETLKAILLSSRTTILSLVVVVILGLPLAYFSARWKSRLSPLIDAIADLPIVLPPAAAGIALLAAFGRMGWIGGPLYSLGVQITFTTTAVVIAQVFVSLPYFVRSAAEGIRAVASEEISAASLDGAGSLRIAWSVILPQCRSALLAGTLLAWARSLGEFGATLMFAGNFVGRTQTIPLAIYAGFEGDLSQAVALSIVLLVLAILVLFVARVVARNERR